MRVNNNISREKALEKAEKKFLRENGIAPLGEAIDLALFQLVGKLPQYKPKTKENNDGINNSTRS